MVSGLKGQENGYSRWLNQRESIIRDSRVTRYYTFENVKDGRSVVEEVKGSGADLVYSPPREGDKVSDDLAVVEGRFEGKKAVRLNMGRYEGIGFNPENKRFTFSCWFRRQGPGGLAAASMVEEGALVSVAGWDRGWRIATVYDSFNTIRFCLGQPGGSEMAVSNVSIPDNVWHHLAATWDGKEMLIYFNGITVGRKEFNGSYVPGRKEDVLRLGNAGDSTGSLVLDMDEAVLYNEPLSSDEIRVLARAGSSPANAVFRAADRCIMGGDFRGARLEYEKLKKMKSVESAAEMALFNIAESFRLEKDYRSCHKVYGEIYSLDGLSDYYRIYALFRQAETFIEEGNYGGARRLYSQVPGVKEALPHHLFKARLLAGDSYRMERKYQKARDIYNLLLKEQDTSSYPHEEYRLDITDRLYSIDGLPDGSEEKSIQVRRAELVEKPGRKIYVSPSGKDDNPGTLEKPFATIIRARDYVRQMNSGRGIPPGGVTVFLRGGNYFLGDTITFGNEDSGSDGSPVVYRGYPGEEARLIGGKPVSNFNPVSDPKIISRLPAESRGRIMVADLRQSGINDFGRLVNRGSGGSRPAALELFFNSEPMRLARWPKDGWLLVHDFVNPGGDGGTGAYAYQKGKFKYSGDRPGRWKEEKDIWALGYFMQPWDRIHTPVLSIDSEKRIVNLGPDIRHHISAWSRYDMPVRKDVPYFFYNILGELSAPGEFYVDRDAGKLYFSPPADIKGAEVIASVLNGPIVTMKGSSNIVLYNLTMEATRRNAVQVNGCRDVMIAGCTIRNTGQDGINISGGWRNSVVGCDIYNTGEGGVRVDGGSRENLIPAGHCVENNHIHHFNRFDGGYRPAVWIDGVGQRISHNLISDSPHQAISMDRNNHVIEYNEIYDVVHEAKDAGAIYLYGEPRYLLNRGIVLRYNFIHHVTEHSSAVPYVNPGINCIYIDALNAGVTMVGNILCRCTGTAVFTHGADSRLENNVFIENRLSVLQGDRSSILNNVISRKRWEDNMLSMIRHNRPPWASRYPQLRNITSYKNVGLPRNALNERNINTGGEFLKEYAVFQSNQEILETYVVRNNLDGTDPVFVNPEALDFSIRTGSPVYGKTGFDTIPFGKIGLYEDPLRASWPVKRSPAGKYYKPEKLSSLPSSTVSFDPLPFVNKPVFHDARRRISPVSIDGKLEKGEWEGLDRSKAVVIEDIIYPLSEERRKGDRSYAWITYDDKYLYVAIENTPNPFRPGMNEKEKYPSLISEISIEGLHDENTWWWQRSIKTGPVYIFSGYSDGRLEIPNNFLMPGRILEYLKKKTEFKAFVVNSEDCHWTAEWKIPLAALNINPAKQDSVRFNVGAAKRGGWLAWVFTGGSAWRLDNGGILKFSR